MIKRLPQFDPSDLPCAISVSRALYRLGAGEIHSEGLAADAQGSKSHKASFKAIWQWTENLLFITGARRLIAEYLHLSPSRLHASLSITALTPSSPILANYTATSLP